MARSYARIMTAIWRDKDFRALASGPQRIYLLLVTQPDISAAGVLALRPRRWADMAYDTAIGDVRSCLRALESARFVVVDWETEEVLIRSFVRWDGGYNNEKRQKMIDRAADEVSSGDLREVLAEEFDRLGLPSNRLRDGGNPPPDDPSGQSISESLFDQVDSPSDGASHVASDGTSNRHGVVVTELTTGEPATHNPQHVPPTAGADAPSAQTLVASWIDGCRRRPPGSVIAQVGKNVKAMLAEGIDPADVQAGLSEWARKSLHPSTLPSVVNEVMNRPAGGAFVNQTDANIAAFLGLDQHQPPHLYAIPGGETA